MICTFRRLGLSLGLLVLLGAGQGAAEPATEFVLATSAQVAQDELPLTQAKLMLAGKTNLWRDGSPVQVVLLPRRSPEMTWLCGVVLGVDEQSYRRLLLQRVYRGEMARPLEVHSWADARKALIRTPGAIGVLPRSELGSELKELRIR